MGVDLKNTRTCLLAAGNGKRAGGPKAWREYQDKTLLERQLDFLLKICEPAFISASVQEAWMEKCTKLNARVRWVPVNPDKPPMAALISLIPPHPALSLRERGRGEGWAFVYHVDMPVWEKGLWVKLAEEASDDFAAVIPCFQGKGGHPVLLSPQAQENILKLDSQNNRLDFWLRTQRVKQVAVPFPCIQKNWNS